MRKRHVLAVSLGVAAIAYGSSLVVSSRAVSPPPGAPPAGEERWQPYEIPREDTGPAFEPNLGQAPPEVLYVSQGPARVTLTRRGARFQLPSGPSHRPLPLDLELRGARPSVRLRGGQPQTGRSHYYVGDDASRWVKDVPHFGRVHYEGVYAGIDASFHGHAEGVEYDFLVHPGADPAAIRLVFRNASGLEIDPRGDLLVHTPRGTARQRAPFAFQDGDGGRREIAARYRVAGARAIAFDLGPYDRTRPLVIDPVLVFGTYIETFKSEAKDVGVDAAGNTYVAGSTDPGDNGQYDVVVFKFAPNGQLVYRVQLGGTREDFAHGIAVEPDGRVWVTGHSQLPLTGSPFPRTTDAFQSHWGGGWDAFFLRLGPAGELQYSSLLGGSGEDMGESIAIGPGGEVFVGVTTASPDMPLQGAVQTAPGGARDFYVAKLDPAASGLVYSTYLGGSGDDTLADVKVASDGRAFLAGHTSSTDFPSVRPLQGDAGLRDVALARLDPSGAVLEQSTYLGGSADETLNGLAVDAAGAAYITGDTDSTDFPLRSPLHSAPTVRAPEKEGFLAKVALDGSLAFSSYLAGNGGGDVAVGPTGAVYLAGGGTIASRLNASLTAYDWFFGRGGWAGAGAVAPLPGGGVSVAGTSVGGGAFPTYNQTASRQPTCADCSTGITVARIGEAVQPDAQHEQDDVAVSYAGTWTTETKPAASGGTLARSTDPAAQFTIAFTGTGLQVLGRRGPSGGLLRGQERPLDPDYTANLHRHTDEPRALLFSITGLSPGTHQMTFVSEAPHGEIWFDGFNVLTGGPMPTATPPARPTSAPTATPVPTTRVRIEDDDPRLVYDGNWYTHASGNHSGGSARLAMDAGASVSLTYAGADVRWIGLRDPWSGIARVYVDGVAVAEVDTYSEIEQPRQPLFFRALPLGTHTLRIEVTGTRNASSSGDWIWIDAIEIEEPLPSTATPTPTPTPTGTSGPTATPARPTPTPTATGAPTPEPTMRIENSDPRIVYSGTWFVNTSPNANHSGGSAHLAGDAGSTATLAFEGTGVKWQGLKDPWAGIARVYVDGALRATVDTYSAIEQLRQTLFTIDGLAAVSHVIRIEVTGTQNPSSGGALVWVDAFDVTSGGGTPTTTPTPRPTGTVAPTATPTPTPPSTPRVTPTPTPTPTGAPTPGITRIEDGDPRITYAGIWYTNTSSAAQHSGGTSRLTGEAAATATLAFNGTGVKWLGLKDPWAGIARVYVDGTLRATVDTYSAVERLRQVLFSVDGLPAGAHTIRIEVTGTRNPSSGGDLVWVDAFDVTS